MIPCSDANVQLDTQINLQAGCEILYCELNSPGRIGRGEQWDFQRFVNSFTVSINRNVIYRENWRLDRQSVPSGPAGFQGCCLWVTGVAIGPQSKSILHKIVSWLKAKGAVVESGTLDPHIAIAKGLDMRGGVLNKTIPMDLLQP